MALEDLPIGIHMEPGDNVLAQLHLFYGVHQQHRRAVRNDFLDRFLIHLHDK